MPAKSPKVKVKAKVKGGLSKKQLSHLEKRLLEERARVMKELGHYGESFNSTLQASDGDLSSYSFHMADQGTDAMEREKQFLFASQEGRYLWHVNEALRRLYGAPGRFGKCEQCGEEIGFDRLDALPHARLCIKCKAKEEDGKRR
jgi:RNA polymerase-binding transcription factor DksA